MTDTPKPVELTEADIMAIMEAFQKPDRTVAMFGAVTRIKAAARREALLEAPKVEITHHLDGPTTCRVEKGGRVLFVGRDWSDVALAEPERDATRI